MEISIGYHRLINYKDRGLVITRTSPYQLAGLFHVTYNIGLLFKIDIDSFETAKDTINFLKRKNNY